MPTGREAGPSKSWLVSGTMLKATWVDREKPRSQGVRDCAKEADALVRSGGAYCVLARSLAPEIFGLEDIKKSLLLQLVGGVSRQFTGGLHIRGDVHVCLVGDPGVAKSQLLKHVASASPRGIYTTGRGSSGVGLTASVVRDSVSLQATLESGALVLADGGLCCIDEFDKLDEHDRSGIHEVMEQQCISIAKAGVTTKLNARCAILAAANPCSGRFNPALTLIRNVNLPVSLLSRFDLIFLMLDKPGTQADLALARHVTHVHRFLKAPLHSAKPFHTNVLRQFVAQAQLFDPHLPIAAARSLADDFVEQRQDSKRSCQQFLTARQLLSILRLAQALARLRFDDEVSKADLDEAMRLTIVSKVCCWLFFSFVCLHFLQHGPAQASQGIGDFVEVDDVKSKAFNVRSAPTVCFVLANRHT